MGENKINFCFRLHVYLLDNHLKNTTTPTTRRGDVNTIMEILHQKNKKNGMLVFNVDQFKKTNAATYNETNVLRG